MFAPGAEGANNMPPSAFRVILHKRLRSPFAPPPAPRAHVSYYYLFQTLAVFRRSHGARCRADSTPSRLRAIRKSKLKTDRFGGRICADGPRFIRHFGYLLTSRLVSVRARASCRCRNHNISIACARMCPKMPFPVDVCRCGRAAVCECGKEAANFQRIIDKMLPAIPPRRRATIHAHSRRTLGYRATSNEHRLFSFQPPLAFRIFCLWKTD